MKRGQLVLAAAFSLVVAACGSGSASSPPDAVPAGGVEITAGDLYFASDGARSTEADLTYTATAGEIELLLVNEGAAVHNVVVEEAGDTLVVEAAGGNSDTGSIQLEPGSYTLYCDIVGHREAGMEAILEVSD